MTDRASAERCPTYKEGDLVRIVAEPWNLHAGDIVQLVKYNPESDSWDFVIPERRGSVPVRMIERMVLPK